MYSFLPVGAGLSRITVSGLLGFRSTISSKVGVDGTVLNGPGPLKPSKKSHHHACAVAGYSAERSTATNTVRRRMTSCPDLARGGCRRRGREDALTNSGPFDPEIVAGNRAVPRRRQVGAVQKQLLGRRSRDVGALLVEEHALLHVVPDQAIGQGVQSDGHG